METDQNNFCADVEPKDITEEMLRIAGKAFFRDCQGQDDYPHKTWEEQRDEFKTALTTGGVSATFVKQVYEWNKDLESEMN